ncbi:MAG: hypothetical protein AB1349_01645 [Elusimicrobiota bacterium]
MPLNSAILKNIVNQAMPTKEQIKNDIWQSLQSAGFKQHGFEGVPDLKDISDKIAERLWQHTKETSDILCEKIIEHIITNAVVSTTVQVVITCPAGPGTGTGTGTGTIS